MNDSNITKALSIKQAIGFKAAQLIENNMLVGLGTGSTAKWFIEALGKRCQEEGLKIEAIATSRASEILALEKKIPLLDVSKNTFLDITIDGADEIDPQFRLIKGGGGALFREKIIATSSKEMVVIVDESKWVNNLGHFGLPIEILPFWSKSTIKKIENKGYRGTLRKLSDQTPYLSDNHNYIFDIHFDNLCVNPEKTYDELRSIIGVIEIGFFFDIAKKAIVGYKDGNIKILSKS